MISKTKDAPDATIEKLRKEGFTSDFKFIEEESVMQAQGIKYSADKLLIQKIFRFDKGQTSENNVVIFAVLAANSLKGLVISGFGAYSDLKLMEFMDQVKIAKLE